VLHKIWIGTMNHHTDDEGALAQLEASPLSRNDPLVLSRNDPPLVLGAAVAS
jgi:hypothetical protein